MLWRMQHEEPTYRKRIAFFLRIQAKLLGLLAVDLDRDRTDDLFHAMEARSQLRHRCPPLGKDSFHFLADPASFVNVNHGTYRLIRCLIITVRVKRALGRRRRCSTPVPSPVAGTYS